MARFEELVELYILKKEPKIELTSSVADLKRSARAQRKADSRAIRIAKGYETGV